MSTWTDEEISRLISLWPTHTAMQIANSLPRSCSAIRGKAKALRNEGLLEAKNVSRSQSINPDPQDFDKAKRDYCRNHRTKLVKLCARLERDDRLAAELYAQAQAAKLTRLSLEKR